MDESKIDNRDELRMDVDRLSESELNELARLIIRKLRELMRQERDRSGR